MFHTAIVDILFTHPSIKLSWLFCSKKDNVEFSSTALKQYQWESALLGNFLRSFLTFSILLKEPLTQTGLTLQLPALQQSQLLIPGLQQRQLFHRHLDFRVATGQLTSPIGILKQLFLPSIPKQNIFTQKKNVYSAVTLTQAEPELPNSLDETLVFFILLYLKTVSTFSHRPQKNGNNFYWVF